MRWMWIDRIVEFVPREKFVAVKNVSLAEEHLHDHFPADPVRGLPAVPVMPFSLVIEGMAQTAGILVGHANGFREKVILAKIGRADLTRDVPAGVTLRYTAVMKRLDESGASTLGTVELIDHANGSTPEEIGRIDLIFSHIDRNLGGAVFPKDNFVFSESFKTLFRTSGLSMDF